MEIKIFMLAIEQVFFFKRVNDESLFVCFTTDQRRTSLFCDDRIRSELNFTGQLSPFNYYITYYYIFFSISFLFFPSQESWQRQPTLHVSWRPNLFEFIVHIANIDTIDILFLTSEITVYRIFKYLPRLAFFYLTHRVMWREQWLYDLFVICFFFVWSNNDSPQSHRWGFEYKEYENWYRHTLPHAYHR